MFLQDGDICEDYSELVSPSNKSRKRKRCPEKWKKNVSKAKRHSSEGKSPSANCAHVAEQSNRLCCVSMLQQADMDLFFGQLYSSKDKQKQDAFLLKCMTVLRPKRKRPRIEESNRRRFVTVKYQVFVLC